MASSTNTKVRPELATLREVGAMILVFCAYQAIYWFLLFFEMGATLDIDGPEGRAHAMSALARRGIRILESPIGTVLGTCGINIDSLFPVVGVANGLLWAGIWGLMIRVVSRARPSGSSQLSPNSGRCLKVHVLAERAERSRSG